VTPAIDANRFTRDEIGFDEQQHGFRNFDLAAL